MPIPCFASSLTLATSRTTERLPPRGEKAAAKITAATLPRQIGRSGGGPTRARSTLAAFLIATAGPGLISTPASAQAARAEAPNIVPRDTIKLKNGALYRGVIVELVPKVSVKMMLISGTMKAFKSNEVDYAGPSEQAPGAAPPAPVAPAPAPVAPTPSAPAPSQLAFNAEGDSDEMITLHEVTASTYGVAVGPGGSASAAAKSFRSLCSSPCKPELSPGTYELALSQGDGRPTLGHRVVVPQGPATIHGTYTSRSGLRLAGLVVLVGGAAAGLGLMAHSFISPTKSCDSLGICNSQYNQTELLIGVGVATVAATVGIVLVRRPDIAGVEVVPGVAGAGIPRAILSGMSESTRVVGTADPAGLTLRARF